MTRLGRATRPVIACRPCGAGLDISSRCPGLTAQANSDRPKGLADLAEDARYARITSNGQETGNRHPGDSEQSSGNVFADLGFAEPEEELTKAELASQIRQVIKRRRLTQVAAAALMGIDQPKVSALLNGRLANFSTDRLRRLLNTGAFIPSEIDTEIAAARQARKS